MALCSSCKKEMDDDDFTSKSQFGGRNQYNRGCVDKQAKRTVRYAKKIIYTTIKLSFRFFFVFKNGSWMLFSQNSVAL